MRSVRVGRKVVQQTVAHLGELDAAGRARARALARAIMGDHAQPDLFDPAEPDATIPVRLKGIRLDRGRTFGDVWLGWTLWRARALDRSGTRASSPTPMSWPCGFGIVRTRSPRTMNWCFPPEKGPPKPRARNPWISDRRGIGPHAGINWPSSPSPSRSGGEAR